MYYLELRECGFGVEIISSWTQCEIKVNSVCAYWG
jgi:hypothetical protein